MTKTVRLVGLAVLLYLIVAVPSVIVGRTISSHAGLGFLIGVALFGVVAVQHGPRWWGGATVLGTVAVFLGTVWGRDPLLLALVLGGTALVAGTATRWARQGALLAVPISAAVLSSPATSATALDRSLGLAAGAAYGALALSLLHIPAPPLGTRLSVRASWLYGGILGGLVAAATVVVTDLDLPHGYWATLTLLSVMQPSIVGSTRKTLQRVAGTVVGSGVALLVAAAVPARDAELALGLGLIVSSVVITKDYAVRTALMTVGVVLLIEGNTPPEQAVELRVGLTVASAAIVLALCVVIPRIIHRFAPSSPADPPTAATP